MRFPELLWTLTNECESGAIAWKKTGVSIVLDYLKFKEEFLGYDGIFKTSNISSFVRQLNLYGFRKCSRTDIRGKIHEFQHPMFVKGREDLMRRMKRKPMASKKKFFRRPSKINKESMDNISERHENQEKFGPKSALIPKSSIESTVGPIGFYHTPPTSSLEQMQKFVWNNPAIGTDTRTPPCPQSWNNSFRGASVTSAPPYYPQSWMSPAYYNPPPQNWIRNISGETGNHNEPCYYGNLPPYGYPVLQRGPEGAYYLLLSGHAPYGYMPPNLDMYRNAMPMPGIPMNMEPNGAGDEASENELVIP